MQPGAATLFTAHGALRVVENRGDDVPAGKLTDMMIAVRANADEAVCLSWIDWPSRTVRDQAWADLMNDPRMQAMGSRMPLDGKRMIFGGFETVIDHRGWRQQ